jgi:hypothetical protein
MKENCDQTKDDAESSPRCQRETQAPALERGRGPFRAMTCCSSPQLMALARLDRQDRSPVVARGIRLVGAE